MRNRYHVKSCILMSALFLALLSFPAMAKPQNAPGLPDLITGLKVVSGMSISPPSPLDINNDNRFGQAEVNYIFQVVAGLRPWNSPENGITVSGFVKDASDGSVPDSRISVELRADVNNDGAYEPDEIFTTRTDDNGFFALTVPGSLYVSKMTVHTRAPGYSDFIKNYENIHNSFSIAAEVSKGEFSEINISGIAASPARAAGRVTLDTDRTVTLKVFRDKLPETLAARISPRFGGTNPAENGNELMSVTFPLRGMDVPAGSNKIYANVAYLDSVNNPDVMPGDFQTEGEGDGPRDMLKTYAASMIKVSDENGNELMTDKTNYSNQIKIKIAIPWEAYDTLKDENPDTADTVEIALYYYDEAAGIWKLQRNADSTPAYGHLEDNFGNVLTATDLIDLQDIELDQDGKFVQTSYAPAGADPSEITIYNVGYVNHFSSYNCDSAGVTGSINLNIKDRNGNPLDAPIRYRKIRGSHWADYDRHTGTKSRRNVQVYRPDQIDNVVSKLLSRHKEERDQWLRYVLSKNDPGLLQAITDGIRKAAIENRGSWADEKSDLARGIKAIFNNKWTTDAVINTNDSIDCSKSPDLCKGIVAQAAEEVSKASDGKKAVAFLMQIAVDSYNPSNLDFDYALDKGIGMMDLAVNTGKAPKQLGNIPALVKKAKDIRDSIKSLYLPSGHPPYYPGPTWDEYYQKTKALKDTVSNIKTAAERLGSSLGRVAARTVARESAYSEDEEGLAKIQKEFLWDYEDVGGVLYGANRFRRFKWGYYQGNTFIQTATPPDMFGGGEIGVFEYFNGSKWVPLPGRSSTGVDAAFVPVPDSISWLNGSASQPVVNLGTWTIDTSPNVSVSGMITDKQGNPLTNGSKIPVYIGSERIYPDTDGNISGTVSVYKDNVMVTIPGVLSRQYPVANSNIDLGTITLEDHVIFNRDLTVGTTISKNKSLEVDGSAFSLTGVAVTYNFKLYSGDYWWWGGSTQDPISELDNNTGIFTLADGLKDSGSYDLVITATAVNFLSDGTHPSSSATFRIQVINQVPTVNDIILTLPEDPLVGKKITVTPDISDADGPDDIRSRWVDASCDLSDGRRIWLGTTSHGLDDQGNSTFLIDTNNAGLFQQLSGDITCEARASVYDRAWSYASKKKSFTLHANSVPPEAHAWISDKYVVAYPMSISPHYVWFTDKNDDIVRYELNCGRPNDSTISSDKPISDTDPDTEGIQECVYDPQVLSGTGPFTFSYKAIDSMGNEKEVTSQITLLHPIDLGVTFPDDLNVPEPDENGDIIIKLPNTEGSRSFTLGLNASSDNGNLTTFRYAVYYQPDYDYGWSTLAVETDDTMDNSTASGTVAVTIDKPGKYYVISSARDSAGLSANFSKTFFVTADFDYRLKLNDAYVEDQKDWYLSTDTLKFGTEAVGDLPEGFVGGYQWDILNADGSPSNISGGTDAQLQKKLPEGSYIIRLTLRNTEDANQPPVVKETLVTVYAPITPTLASDYVFPVQADGAVALGDLYTLTAQVDLPDGVQVASATFRVTKSDSSSAEGLYTVAGSNGLLTRTYIFNTPGSYLVSVQIQDSRGLVGNAEPYLFEVKEYPPVINSLTADKTSGPPPLTVTATATAHDPDGQVVNYIWKITGTYTGTSGQTVYLNETKIQNSENSTTPETLAYPFANEGKYNIGLVVEDNSGRKSGKLEKSITVAYPLPVIESLTADPENGNPPLQVGFTASASNPDGTKIVSYAWDVGADGVIEQTGLKKTFTHTFNAVGRYPVDLTVTDSRGKTAVKRKTIVVYDESTRVEFSFKEIRADGLGSDVDFSAIDPEMYQEMFGKFAQTPYDDVTFSRENAVDLTNPMLGVLGFDGFYSEAGCSPMLYLAKINTPGTYDIGVNTFESNDSNITLNFPTQYTCAAIVYSNYAQTYGTDDPIDPAGTVTLYPSGDNFNRQGRINILALLGSEVVDGTYCKTTYMGFISGTGSSFTVDNSNQVQRKPLVIPEGLTLSDVSVILNGIRISFGEYGLSNLPKDALERYLLPIVPGADYELKLKKTGSTATYNLRYTAAEIAAAGDNLQVDAGLFKTTTLNLANLPSSEKITLVYSGVRGTVTNSIDLDGSETSLTDIALLSNSTDLEITTNKLFKKTTVAQLGGTLDFSTLVGTSLTAPAITVDETQKTVTVSYTSSAPMAVVDISIYFADGNYSQFSFITDPAKTSFTVPYAIPAFDIEQQWGTQSCPAHDTIQSVDATVTAMQPTDSYDESLRSLFTNLGALQWYDKDFRDKANIKESVTVTGSWTKP